MTRRWMRVQPPKAAIEVRCVGEAAERSNERSTQVRSFQQRRRSIDAARDEHIGHSGTCGAMRAL